MKEAHTVVVVNQRVAKGPFGVPDSGFAVLTTLYDGEWLLVRADAPSLTLTHPYGEGSWGFESPAVLMAAPAGRYVLTEKTKGDDRG